MLINSLLQTIFGQVLTEVYSLQNVIEMYTNFSRITNNHSIEFCVNPFITCTKTGDRVNKHVSYSGN